jgi:hypothetical protein
MTMAAPETSSTQVGSTRTRRRQADAESIMTRIVARTHGRATTAKGTWQRLE